MTENPTCRCRTEDHLQGKQIALGGYQWKKYCSDDPRFVVEWSWMITMPFTRCWESDEILWLIIGDKWIAPIIIESVCCKMKHSMQANLHRDTTNIQSNIKFFIFCDDWLCIRHVYNWMLRQLLSFWSNFFYLQWKIRTLLLLHVGGKNLLKGGLLGLRNTLLSIRPHKMLCLVYIPLHHRNH